MKNIYQDQIKEYHNWNFALNIASGGFDNFGLSLVGPLTVLPAFLTLFTRSNFIIGLLPALFVFFWTFPQILTAFYTSHFRQKKNVIVFLRTAYALPWLILAILLMLFVLKPGSGISMVIFFVFLSLFALLGGFTVPTWASFISKLIFPNVRGRFFALRIFVGTIFGILASFIVKNILEIYEYPFNFSLIFLLAFSMFLLGTVFLAISKEPLTPYQIKRKTFSEYLTKLRHIMENDKPFVWFIISTTVRSFGATIMAAAFYTVYAIQVLQTGLNQVGLFMGIMFSTQLIGALIFGYINDLTGPKRIQIMERLFEFLSVGVLLWQPNIIGVYCAFGFLGLAVATMMISYHNMIIELAPCEDVDTYMGLINSIRAISLALAPMIGGFLADRVSYTPVFIIAMASSLLSALIFILKVKPQRSVLT